jgi:hypothetical protein
MTDSDPSTPEEALKNVQMNLRLGDELAFKRSPQDERAYTWVFGRSPTTDKRAIFDHVLPDAHPVKLVNEQGQGLSKEAPGLPRRAFALTFTPDSFEITCLDPQGSILHLDTEHTKELKPGETHHFPPDADIRNVKMVLADGLVFRTRRSEVYARSLESIAIEREPQRGSR